MSPNITTKGPKFYKDGNWFKVFQLFKNFQQFWKLFVGSGKGLDISCTLHRVPVISSTVDSACAMKAGRLGSIPGGVIAKTWITVLEPFPALCEALMVGEYKETVLTVLCRWLGTSASFTVKASAQPTVQGSGNDRSWHSERKTKASIKKLNW